ncbi:hypothetical protein GF352_03910 [archaeon]|nr:hypothetical protein [archaeon]
MKKFFKHNKCAIPLLFLLAYGVPMIYLFTNYSFNIGFLSRMLGLTAFLNVLLQVMLGSFRDFFKEIYHPVKVFRFHNYLGVATLIIASIHVIIRGLIDNNLLSALLFNNSISNNLGAAAFYIMFITVGTSDLKYFFNVNYNNKLWRIIHVFNYALFPIIFLHALNGVTLQNVINYYLFIGYMIVILLSGAYRVYDKVIK